MSHDTSAKARRSFFTAEKRALLPFGAAAPDPDRGDPQAVKDGQDSSKDKSVVFMQAKAKNLKNGTAGQSCGDRIP